MSPGNLQVEYQNIYILSILDLYHHLFAKLVPLYNLPLYWVCWGLKRFLVFDCRVVWERPSSSYASHWLINLRSSTWGKFAVILQNSALGGATRVYKNKLCSRHQPPSSSLEMASLLHFILRVPFLLPVLMRGGDVGILGPGLWRLPNAMATLSLWWLMSLGQPRMVPRARAPWAKETSPPWAAAPNTTFVVPWGSIFEKRKDGFDRSDKGDLQDKKGYMVWNYVL